jgi:hypothetical protein
LKADLRAALTTSAICYSVLERGIELAEQQHSATLAEELRSERASCVSDLAALRGSLTEVEEILNQLRQEARQEEARDRHRRQKEYEREQRVLAWLIWGGRVVIVVLSVLLLFVIIVGLLAR